MVTEQFTNNAITTLNGGIASGDTSLIVTSATLFPTSPQFRIIVDSEIMLVTSVSGTTFFVTRGVENTTAVAHLSGATIEHILTAGAVQQLKTDVKPLFTNILNNVSSNGSYPTTVPTNWSASYTPTKSGLVLITATCQGGQSGSGNLITANLQIDNTTVISTSMYANTNGIHRTFPTVLYSTTLSITAHTIKILLSGTTVFADNNDFATIWIQEF